MTHPAIEMYQTACDAKDKRIAELEARLWANARDTAIIYSALEQAQDCIRGETPEDMTDLEARVDTIGKIREAMAVLFNVGIPDGAPAGTSAETNHFEPSADIIARMEAYIPGEPSHEESVPEVLELACIEIRSLRSEIAALKHDLERHVEIASREVSDGPLHTPAPTKAPSPEPSTEPILQEV